MRYLGLDVGQVRVGVALSDEGGTIAFPFGVLSRTTCIDQIRAIAVDQSVATVVIGESLDLDGNENEVMRDVRDLAKQLKKSVPVVFEPEQFSTQAASRLGKGTDAEAAAIILQSYLDRVSENKGA
ncbi:MAG: RuvX/YqgF family protein [Candidatus Kaiserbacteria bacterium]|nr:RuvX/YqgF family protein [Candidatus Kaiserbacteria bacterium]